MESWRERTVKRKLEQATDPARPLRRGFFKGRRPKGRKARLDELMQARKEFFYYLDRVEDDKGQTAELVTRSRRYAVGGLFTRWHKEQLKRFRKRYSTLLEQCQKDGLL